MPELRDGRPPHIASRKRRTPLLGATRLPPPHATGRLPPGVPSAFPESDVKLARPRGSRMLAAANEPRPRRATWLVITPSKAAVWRDLLARSCPTSQICP